MDDTVIRAMQQWPNVPAVYGWLALDRRGDWRIKSNAGRFECVAHAGMSEFIGRNYTRDDEGCWYFQNGPQKVYVSLDYTPWVYRLDSTATRLTAHTNAVPNDYRHLFLDDTDTLLVETELGIGVLLDRDLQSLLSHLTGLRGESAELVLEEAARGDTPCRFFGRSLSCAPIRAADIPTRFNFVPRPVPPAGQPEC
jgi:hypothetical protein